MIRCLFLAIALSSPCLALAEDATRQAPISLRADRIEVDQKTGLSRYQGKVVITQGMLRVTADKVVVERQGELLRRIRAQGSPATFRDRPEGQDLFIEGQAQTLEYEALARKLRLAGQVTFVRGDDILTAGEIHYNLNNQSASARRLGDQRVVATLEPVRPAGPAGATP